MENLAMDRAILILKDTAELLERGVRTCEHASEEKRATADVLNQMHREVSECLEQMSKVKGGISLFI